MSIKLICFWLFLIAFLLFPGNLFSQDIFTGLSSGEAEILQNYGIVTRSLKNKKDLAINIESNDITDIISSIYNLNPNYISEVISVIPFEGNQNGTVILEKLKLNLWNIEDYVTIPYFSSKWNKTFNLYDWLEIVELNKNENGFSANVNQSMKPFGEIQVQYNLTWTKESLYFWSQNLSSISYNGIRAVKKGKMMWFLSAQIYQDKLVIYGVGAAKAFDMFGTLRSRLEPAFVGRAEAFFMAFLN